MRLLSCPFRTFMVFLLSLALAGVYRDSIVVIASDTEAAPATEAKSRSRARGGTKVTREVKRAIRQLMSSRAAERQRGRKKLAALGAAVAPQLERWIRLARDDVAQVEEILAELTGENAGLRMSESVDRFLHEKLRAAKALARDGEYRRAQQVAGAILALDGGRPDAWRIRAFVRKCQERLTIREVLEPRFEIGQRVYQIGDTPVLTFRVHNHTKETAVIYLDKGVLGQAKVTVSRYFMNGEWKSAEQRITVRVAETSERLEIAAGQAWEQTVQFQMQESLPLTGAVARVQLSGRFRPTRWTARDPKDNATLSLPRLEFWIVPPGQSPLTDKPLEKMIAALLFEKDESFFVGGQLAVWAGEFDALYNGKFVETLIEQLDSLEGARLLQACRFLGQATGETLAADREAWKRWWQRGRQLPEDAPEARPGN